MIIGGKRRYIRCIRVIKLPELSISPKYQHCAGDKWTPWKKQCHRKQSQRPAAKRRGAQNQPTNLQHRAGSCSTHRLGKGRWQAGKVQQQGFNQASRGETSKQEAKYGSTVQLKTVTTRQRGNLAGIKMDAQNHQTYSTQNVQLTEVIFCF